MARKLAPEIIVCLLLGAEMAGRMPEEVMVLRCPESVAGSIRSAMADKHSANALHVELNFRHANSGKLVVAGEEHRIVAQKLPCLLEAYKSYTDCELVKANDIGTLLVALPSRSDADAEAGSECPDGVCPSLSNVRERFFKKPHNHTPDDMAEAERIMERTLHGRGPAKPLTPDEVSFEAEWETDEEAQSRRQREKEQKREKKRRREREQHSQEQAQQ
jgi:hypothetical protein